MDVTQPDTEDLQKQYSILQSRFGDAMNSLPSGLCFLSEEWEILWANNKLARLYNPTLQDGSTLAGKSFRVFFSEQKAFESYIDSAEYLLAMEGRTERELRFRFENGGNWRAEVTLAPCRTDSSAAYVAIVTDVTRRYLAERNLKAKLSSHRALMNESMDVIIRTNTDGEIIYVNPTAEEFYAIGDKFLSMIYEADRAEMAEMLDTLRPDTPHANFEGRIFNKKGDIQYLTWTARALSDENDKFTGFSGIGHNITDRMKAKVIITQAGLTEREAEIFSLVVDGYTNLNISAILGITEDTVRFHLKKIYKKVGVASRTQLVGLTSA